MAPAHRPRPRGRWSACSATSRRATAPSRTTYRGRRAPSRPRRGAVAPAGLSRSMPAPGVIAIFGPTASGKTAGRGGGRGRDRRRGGLSRTRCRSTRACRSSRRSPAADPPRRDLAARTRPRSWSTPASRTTRSTRPSTAAARRGRRHRPLPAGRAGRPGRPAGARAGARARWEAFYDEEGRRRTRALAAKGSRPPRRPSERPAESRPRARARRGRRVARPRAIGSGRTRRATPRSSSASTCPSRRSTVGSRSGRGGWSPGRGGVRSALAAAPLSSTARHILGLRELVELPPEEAAAALVRRTRRYAAYQRKWMRRIPASLPLLQTGRDEVADEILQVAGAREHLSRHRAAP